jgi:quinoprotein glucose dehydrogenase
MRNIYTCAQAAVSVLRQSVAAARQLTGAKGRAAALAAGALLAAAASAQSPDASDWGSYGQDAFGQRFSSLDEVNRTSISRLDVAWTYQTRALDAGVLGSTRMSFAATPVLAFGLLYLQTPTNIVIALDPDTGAQHWRRDLQSRRDRAYAEVVSRGVSVWQDSDPKHQGPCAQRVLAGTLDARLVALDARTGDPCDDFGTAGVVDLTAELRIPDRAGYEITSPPAIYGASVIVGATIEAAGAATAGRGIIRAYDVRTGAKLWSFDPLPDSPDHPAAGEWQPQQAASAGGGGAWGVMSVDEDSGMVLVPTGPASPAYFGGTRTGSNRFASSLLALDARTGKLLWSRQLVHHDLWNLDVAAQPVLADIEVQGVPRPAVVQATASGMIYVFDRTRGEEIFPIIEKPVPVSHVPSELAWPTQPFSMLPPLVPQQKLKPADAWGITFWDRSQCRDLIASHRNEGIFTPPDLTGTITLPGHLGGVGWGGITFDEDRQRIIAAVNLMPEVVTLVPRAEYEGQVRSGRYPQATFGAQAGTPYGVRREPLLSPWGLPCTPPPWGQLVSVDLRHNRIVWQVPLGSSEGMGPKWAPPRDFGVPSAGGPLATAGNLVFMAGTRDGYFRAFDIETGRLLWKRHLPAGGQSTPMSYRAGRDQRQFIVICAGGNGPLGVPVGDYVIAFALPPLSQRKP